MFMPERNEHTVVCTHSFHKETEHSKSNDLLALSTVCL